MSERRAYYLGAHTMLTSLYDGTKIYLDTRDISVVPHLIMDGFWESWITKHWEQQVQPGMIVWDVGSHVGYYALLAGRRVGRAGQVHAFEPNTAHHRNFLRSLSVNGLAHVTLHPVALADRTGTAEFFVPDDLSADAALTGVWNRGELNLNGQRQNVRTVTPQLADAPVPDVLKIDAEGSEPLILPGLLSRLDEQRKPTTMFVEYRPSLWQKNEFDTRGVFAGCLDRGFEIHVIEHDAALRTVSLLELVEGSGPAEARDGHLDLMFSRR